MTAASEFFAALAGRDASSGVSAMGVAQAPDTDDHADASAERAEMVGGHQADGPDLEPVYEGARPLVDETHAAALVAAVRSVLTAPPVPGESVAIAVTLAAGVAAMIVPPGGGRPRSVHLRNTGANIAHLSPERRDDATGVPLGAAVETDANGGRHWSLDTRTDGAVYAYSASGTTVAAWVDYDAER